MPKSRGRKKPQRRAEPVSWTSSVLTEARQLLDPGVTRTYAELFASDVLGRVHAARESEQERDLVEVAVRELTEQAARKRTAPAAALVAALAHVSDEPRLAAELEEWAAVLVAHLAWASAPAPTLRGVSLARDPYDDERDVLLHYDDCVVVAQTSRALGLAVLTIRVSVPELLQAWDDDPESLPREPAAPEATVAWLREAFERCDAWWPPIEDEDFVAHRAFLAARLRATGVRAEAEPVLEVGDDELQAAVDRFAAATGLSAAAERRAAFACAVAGAGSGAGALFWSPALTEGVIATQAYDDLRDDAPALGRLTDVTEAWARWVLSQRGLAPEHVEAAAVVARETAQPA